MTVALDDLEADLLALAESARKIDDSGLIMTGIRDPGANQRVETLFMEMVRHYTRMREIKAREEPAFLGRRLHAGVSLANIRTLVREIRRRLDAAVDPAPLLKQVVEEFGEHWPSSTSTSSS